MTYGKVGIEVSQQERPADAVKAVGSRADDRHMRILLRDEYQLGAAGWNGTDSVRSRFRFRDAWSTTKTRPDMLDRAFRNCRCNPSDTVRRPDV